MKKHENMTSTKAYYNYKTKYVKRISFNPKEENLMSEYTLNLILKVFFPATTLDHAPLEAVHIYFDTATYDEIERDEKVALDDNDLIYW